MCASQIEAPSRQLYKREYTSQVVDRWDDYIDWEKRREAEDGFFAKQLRDQGARRILDAACGTGFHTVDLAEEGFEVVGADGSQNMVDKARENAEGLGFANIPFLRADWTSLTERFPEGSFDAVVCLGNSFTHLFDEPSRIKALAEMRRVLKDGGALILDQRNYDAMLDRDDENGHSLYYMGDSVEVTREELTEESLRFRFDYDDGAVSHLTISPIRQNYVTGLLRKVGFGEVQRYGDFQAEYEFYEPEFVIHLARK